MGSLILPVSSRVGIDTQVVIYTAEKHPDYLPLLQPLWTCEMAREIEVVASELTLMETLVGPYKSGNVILEAVYEQIMTVSEIRLLSITPVVLRTAARLRANYNLRTPDAIHAATALEHPCDLFITNDPIFRRVRGLPLILLNDLL